MLSKFNWLINRIKLDIKNRNAFRKFLSQKVPEKSVLIFEPNNCHAEVLPSYAKYWRDSGYKTDIIITDKQLNPFEKIPADTRLFSFNLKRLKRAVSSKKIKEYDYMFFTSSQVFYKYKHKNSAMVWDFFKIAHPKKDIIYTIHDRSELPEDCKKTLVLTKAIENKPYVCPCYFYKEPVPRKKNGIVNFITVGKMEEKRKDVKLLHDALERIKDKNFKITVIGEEDSKIQELKRSHIISNINFKGRLDFMDVYKEMENADFYLPLLNPELHKRYINDAASGSFQLIMGFLKIPVIHKSFCGTTGFNENNSVIYTDNFAQALQKCIDMPEEEFLAKQRALKDLFEETMRISLNNLKNLINN